MNLPFKKQEKNPLDIEMEELAAEWALEEIDSERRHVLIERYKELNQMRLEEKKLEKSGAIDSKTLFNAGVTLGLALLTLNFEQFDTLRSKASTLWLRRER